jgi:general secretion pathway protein D
MIVPTEYEAAEPANVVVGAGVGGAGNVSSPVTSATPVAFRTVKVGCQLEVEPLVGPNRKIVELAIKPTLRRFEGFINYGSPINAPVVNAVGSTESLLVALNAIEMPIFSVISSNSNLTIGDGQTVVMGGLLEDNSFKYEDKVPIFGDLPWFGRFFRSESETNEKNAMVIMVTVNILDPSGRPYRDR